MSEHDFCRKILSDTRKSLTPKQRQELAGSSVYVERTPVGCDKIGEFFATAPTNGERFYWYGSVDCAWDARTQGIEAWLDKFYPELRRSER